jgi:hypothetical protein
MKRIFVILSVILTTGLLNANAQCCAGASKAEAITKSCCDKSREVSEVKAYYFHATRRCATCQAVESVTKEALKEYYGDKVAFTSINHEEEKDNPLIEKYEISGQTLLIIKGDEVVNLTNDAFLNARTKPEKFKSKLKTTIDSML